MMILVLRADYDQTLSTKSISLYMTQITHRKSSPRKIKSKMKIETKIEPTI